MTMFNPATDTLLITGCGTTSESTETLPSTARLLLQTTPEPVTPIAPPPVTGWLKRTKRSPTAKVGPRFVMTTRPVPALIRAPLTLATLFEGESDLLTGNRKLPVLVTGPLIA